MHTYIHMNVYKRKIKLSLPGSWTTPHVMIRQSIELELIYT